MPIGWKAMLCRSFLLYSTHNPSDYVDDFEIFLDKTSGVESERGEATQERMNARFFDRRLQDNSEGWIAADLARAAADPTRLR